MRADPWQQLRLPDVETSLSELYHENSKLSRHDPPIDGDAVARRMARLLPSLPYEALPKIALPPRTPLTTSVEDALLRRVSGRTFAATPLPLSTVAALLWATYGITRDNRDTGFPRPFRTTPSAGALYPLEIFFHATAGDELAAGLYHFDPSADCLHHVVASDLSRQLTDCLVQPELALASSLIVFFTAMFDRSSFKYGERAYRFTLLEAGHAAQNLALAAAALDLATVPLGGYFDRATDRLLGLDGVTHSTVYAMCVGVPSPG